MDPLLQASDFKFTWIEYLVVAVMLLLSTLIGVYYTFFNKQNTFDDYMLGGKSMGVFPVSMSIVASFVSGILLIGIPLEVYMYGTQYSCSDLGNFIVMVICSVFYLPIYYKLQLSSVFEYLELRFSYKVRILGTFMYSMYLMVFLPAVMYVPALAFSQVSDVPIHVISPIISSVCLFYTAFGGLKAVLWTDALQNVFTVLALIFVVVIGCGKMGGFQEIWRISREGSRLELFNMDPDPFARNTFWTVSIGCVFMFLTNIAVNPGSVQRFLAVPTLSKARWVLFYSSVGFSVIGNLAFLFGLVLYARYHGCDPMASGMIKNPGQMVPLYVMEIGNEYPGLAGLFISGVISAALSTMSAWLNTVGGTLYKDVMEVFFPHVKHSESKQSNIIKTIIIILGIITVALVSVVEKLGTILQMSISLLGLVNGSLLSLFTLGIFFPRVNTKGAIAGTVASMLLSGWIVMHAQYYILENKIQFPGKVTSIDQCPSNLLLNSNSSFPVFDYTGTGSKVVVDSSVPLLYQISYNYYIVIGTMVGILVGLAVSYLTPAPDLETMNPDLFSPYVHSFLPSKITRPNKNEYRLTDQRETSRNGVVEGIKTVS